MTAPTLHIAPPGLKGVQVAETSIGSVRGAQGYYHYRQYEATALAKSRSLEAVWQLVMDGELRETDEPFAREVASARTLSAKCISVLKHVAMSKLPPHLGLIAALPHVIENSRPTLDLLPQERRRDVVRVCAAVPTVLATLEALQNGMPCPLPEAELSHAENWLRMATGTVPTPLQVRAVATYLIATIDHGFNASTFATRVVTSTGADVVSAICGGIGALSGPLHGGAPSRALSMIQDIGAPNNTESWVQNKLKNGEKIMGFGHAVYRADDPRSVLLKEIALEFDSELVGQAVAIEAEILRTLRTHKPNATIVTNVEYYAGLVLHLAGLAPQMFTSTFMVSRVIGWGAHVLEQAANNRIIRPSARYVGQAPSSPPC